MSLPANEASEVQTGLKGYQRFRDSVIPPLKGLTSDLWMASAQALGWETKVNVLVELITSQVRIELQFRNTEILKSRYTERANEGHS